MWVTCCKQLINAGIDVNKTSTSKECDICHYWFFKDIGFKYEPYLCNGCHDWMQKAMSFNDVTNVYVKESAYRIHFWYTSRDDAISIMNNSNLIDKKMLYNCFYQYIKMNEWNSIEYNSVEETYYQKTEMWY